jgi:hypothetical protein
MNVKANDSEKLPKKEKAEPCPGKVHDRCQQGLDVRKLSSPGGSGEVFLLDIPFYRTSPFIEPAICLGLAHHDGVFMF